METTDVPQSFPEAVARSLNYLFFIAYPELNRIRGVMDATFDLISVKKLFYVEKLFLISGLIKRICR